jgi:Tol biopolymer transport system component
MNYDGSEKKRLLRFFGGQGSINVNSWSEDSRYVAFVSYELKHEI